MFKTIVHAKYWNMFSYYCAFVNYVCLFAVAVFYIVKSIPVTVTRSHIDGVKLHTMLPSAEESFDSSDENNGFVDDEPELGSSEGALPRRSLLDSCLKIQQELVARGLAGAYIPHCSDHTDYMQTECFTSGDKCWCVNSQGHEVSSNDSDSRKNCTFIGNTPFPLQFQQLPVPSELDSTAIPSPFYTNFVNTQNAAFTDHEFYNQMAINSSREQSSNNETVMYNLPRRLWMYVMDEPLWYAAVLGIGAFVVVAVVLLVLCIVYRVRKKDEGSYALDESGQTPSQYARAPSQDREFFA